MGERELRVVSAARRAADAVTCELLESRQLMAANPVISEFLASNSRGLRDASGDQPDWVEIHNAGDAPADLAGWSLTDNADAPAKWVFPAGVTLPAGARLVVFASGEDRRVPTAELHTNFEIAADGEYLALVPPGGAAPASAFDPFPPQRTDVSYGTAGADPGGALRFFGTPTPGDPNGAGIEGVVADTKFSRDRGYHDAPFGLEITTATPGATIRYTLDGSPPSSTGGVVYTGPIEVNHTTVVRAIAYRDGFLPTNVDTQTYILFDDVLRQPRLVNGWPNPAIPVDSDDDNTRVHDYEMDPDIVNSNTYRAAARKGLTDIPTMSLVVRQADMWDANGQGGFYREDDVEKAVSVEVIYPDDPAKSEQTDGGVEGHSHDRMKRTLRLNFRAEYGDGKFDTELFEDAAVLNGDSAADEFDTIILRAGNNRAWSRVFNPDRTTFTEDQFLRDTQIAMTGEGAHGAFVHLYINGIYWGLYNPTEYPDEKFTATYFPGGEDDWFSVNHGGPKGGDETRWEYLTGALKNKNMATLANYRELERYLDTKNFADYVLLHFYAGVRDWPHNNWWAGNRNGANASPTKFFTWDGEWSFGVGLGSPNKAWVAPEFAPSAGQDPGLHVANIFNSAKRSDEFLTVLADRAYKATAAGGALSDAEAVGRWDALNAAIRDAVVDESARWGDVIDPASPRTRNGQWQTEVDQIRTVLQGNAADLIAALRSAGYYPSNDPPTLSAASQEIEPGFTLTLANPNGGGSGGGGTVYYTLDGTDPRAAGGGVSSAADPYTGGGLTLNGTTRVLARVRSSSGEWSAAADATFTVPPPAQTVARPRVSWLQLPMSRRPSTPSPAAATAATARASGTAARLVAVKTPTSTGTRGENGAADDDDEEENLTAVVG